MGGAVPAGPLLFSVTPIQPPSGYTSTNAFPGINNLGQVVGAVSGPGGASSLFISNGSSFTLLSIPDDWNVNHTFINNSGQIAGFATTPAGTLIPFIGTASGVTAIPTPPDTGPLGASVLGLDNLGQVVGGVDTGDGFLAFVGTSAGITVLPYQAGLGINDAGQVLVENLDVSYIISGATAVPVSCGGNLLSVDGQALNDAGQALFSGNPCVATTTTATPVPQPPGTGTNLVAYLNNEGAVAGINAATPGMIVGPGVLWIWDPVDGTEVISLPDGWTVTDISGINDTNQVVGFGSFTPTGQSSPTFTGDVILTEATPEPSTLSMMLAAIGFAGIILAKRER